MDVGYHLWPKHIKSLCLCVIDVFIFILTLIYFCYYFLYIQFTLDYHMIPNKLVLEHQALC